MKAMRGLRAAAGLLLLLLAAEAHAAAAARVPSDHRGGGSGGGVEAVVGLGRAAAGSGEVPDGQVGHAAHLTVGDLSGVHGGVEGVSLGRYGAAWSPPFTRRLAPASPPLVGGDVAALQALLTNAGVAPAGGWASPGVFDAQVGPAVAAWRASAGLPEGEGVGAGEVVRLLECCSEDGYADDGAPPAATGHLYKLLVPVHRNRSVELSATLLGANNEVLHTFKARAHGYDGGGAPQPWPHYSRTPGLTQLAPDGNTPTGLYELDLNTPEGNATLYGPYAVNRAVRGLAGNAASVYAGHGVGRSGILVHTGEWLGWGGPGHPMPDSMGCVHAHPADVATIAGMLMARSIEPRKNTAGKLPYPYSPRGLMSVYTVGDSSVGDEMHSSEMEDAGGCAGADDVSAKDAGAKCDIERSHGPAAGRARTRRREMRWWVPANDQQGNLALFKEHPEAVTGIYTYLGLSASPAGTYLQPHSDQQMRNLTAGYISAGLTVMPAFAFDEKAVLAGLAGRAAENATAVAARLAWDGLMLDYEPSGNYSASHVRMYATAIEAFAKAAHAKGLRLGVCIGNWGIVDAHEVPQGMKIYESAGADILMSMGATYHAYGDLSKDRDFVSEVYSQGVAQGTYSVGVGTTLTSGCPRPAKTDFNWTEASLGAWFNWLSDDTRAPAAIDVWRADIDAPGNCTEPFFFPALAKWLAGGAHLGPLTL